MARDRLFEIYRRIRAVVTGRPCRVAVLDCMLGQRNGQRVRELFEVSQDLAHFVHSGPSRGRGGEAVADHGVALDRKEVLARNQGLGVLAHEARLEGCPSARLAISQRKPGKRGSPDIGDAIFAKGRSLSEDGVRVALTVGDDGQWIPPVVPRHLGDADES